MNYSNDYFAKINSDKRKVVTDVELNSLFKYGFVVLKRSKKYWTSLGIDLKKVQGIVENEIGSFEFKPDSYRKIDHTYRYEKGTNRLSNLLARNKVFYPFINIPDILFCVYKVLGKKFRLSSLGMREPLKGAGHQGLHIDWLQRKTNISQFFQVSAFILLDKVTKHNGAPRIIPQSHEKLVNVKSTSEFKYKRKPSDHILLEKEDNLNSKYMTGSMGDIIILNVNAFHGGSKNITGGRRRIIVADYRISSERSQVDHYKAIPKLKHGEFTDLQKGLLDLKEKTLNEKLKRWAYENRDNKLVSSLIKFKSLIKVKI